MYVDCAVTGWVTTIMERCGKIAREAQERGDTQLVQLMDRVLDAGRFALGRRIQGRLDSSEAQRCYEALNAADAARPDLLALFKAAKEVPAPPVEVPASWRARRCRG